MVIFYDDSRLKSSLLYLNKEFADRQILIFSCTDREYDVLSQLGINFNNISL